MTQTEFEQNLRDKMSSDPDNYKLGIIYFNRQDSRYVVPKANPEFGWTLNFGHPNVLYILLVLVIGTIVGGLLSVIF
jgi:uncharacterized membrane protein